MIELSDGVVLASPGEDVSAEIVLRMPPDFGLTYPAYSVATRVVIEAMRGVDFAGRSVLDLGTGSGVLALLAARMGADRVVAAEYDSSMKAFALTAFEANEGVEIECIDADDGGRYDVIVANIGDAEPLLPLAERCDVLICTAPTKRKLLSGGRGTRPEFAAVAQDVATRIRRAGREAAVIPFDDGSDWALVQG
jgi:ribosomal protein L11 methylase PrmA